MENPFFSQYFKFAKSITKGNYITAIINTDYNERNINLLINKQNELRSSVQALLEYAKTLSGIPRTQTRDLKKLINNINKKARSLDNYRISSDEILHHYYSIENATNISYVVVFKSCETWNVNFTSSLRSDRMDTHSNRFMQANATKNYLVVCSYPYQDDSSLKCINTIKQNPTYYGSNINIVCLEEFMDDLMYNIFRYKTDASGNLTLAKPKNELSIVNGERGVQIEHMYANILKNKKNFELYLNGTPEIEREQTLNSFLPNHYSIIIDRLFTDLGITPSQVSNIDAIPIGEQREKTDISITITLTNGRSFTKGISIKSSSIDYVSVHEKHAIDFITVLGITDPTLQNAFTQFEKRRALSKLDKLSYTSLSDYYADDTHKIELLEWAIAGEKTDPLKADYILLHSYNYNSKEALGHGIKILSCQEYIDELMSSDLDGSFGTHLTWTYKGNIQLNAPFLFE